VKEVWQLCMYIVNASTSTILGYNSLLYGH
jgi:hypothetical protein